MKSFHHLHHFIIIAAALLLLSACEKTPEVDGKAKAPTITVTNNYNRTIKFELYDIDDSNVLSTEVESQKSFRTPDLWQYVGQRMTVKLFIPMENGSPTAPWLHGIFDLEAGTNYIYSVNGYNSVDYSTYSN